MLCGTEENREERNECACQKEEIFSPQKVFPLHVTSMSTAWALHIGVRIHHYYNQSVSSSPPQSYDDLATVRNKNPRGKQMTEDDRGKGFNSQEGFSPLVTS
jgi:hypothetical protein